MNNILTNHGGKLHIFKGNPEQIFRKLIPKLNIKTICFEQDCEPIWRKRDDAVTKLCQEMNVECIEKVSHTLWDPKEIIKSNGGIPPLTYQMFLHTSQTIGPPPRPVDDPEWRKCKFTNMPDDIVNDQLYVKTIPKPEDFGVTSDAPPNSAFLKWKGGETQALLSLKDRLSLEKLAFENGYYLPNQVHHNFLQQAISLSAHLRYGCMSVRKFYWNIHDLFLSVQNSHDKFMKSPGGPHITGQLIWREYFYTMSVFNPHYAQMKQNPICLDIPWYEPTQDILQKWKMGKTGYPLIDAAMRQLISEGWLHHTLRNTTASFLTRGGMWISWEYGVQHFLKYLLDADWSVCAGNWMWVSSSAFEQLLDSSRCTCPIALGKRLDPDGEYIKRYVPELRGLPISYM